MELLCTRGSRHVYSRHTHDAYAIGMVEAGHYGFADRGRQWIARPHRSVIMVNPDDAHDGRPLDGGTYDYRMLYGAPVVLSSLVAEQRGGGRSGAPFFPAAMVEDAELAQSLQLLHRTLEAGRAAGKLERETRFIEAMARLVSRHTRRRPAASQDPGRYGRAASRAREFLEAHLAENVSLSRLAQQAGLSRFHLLRLFRAEYGLPPHAWLMQQRLKRARQLLQARRAPAEIATELGFVDQSHLTRRFHAAYGLTPGQYCAQSAS